MADEQSPKPLVQHLQVGSGGNAVVAGSIANVNVYSRGYQAPLDPFATVPPLPAGFVPRPEISEPIFRGLSTEGTVALTAIEGMGGIGKTIVVNELCHDPRVRTIFKDGILWFTIGKQFSLTPEALTREMALHLNQEFRVYSAAAYRSLFRDKSVLVVLDDVWTLDAIEPFLLDPGSSKLLYTTRNRRVADSTGAKSHDVGLLNDEEARSFLARRSGCDPLQLPEPEATDILSECRGLVLGLAMIGAALRNKPVSYWVRIVRNLREARLRETGTRVANYAYHTLWASIAASVEELSPEDRARYYDLAILLEDMPYPAILLRQIWGGELDEAEAAMGLLVDRSLASREAAGSIRLHDFQLDFVRGEYPQPMALALAHSALLRSLHVVGPRAEQFASQMAGRLLSRSDEPGIGELLERLRANAVRPCLWPLWPSLEQAGSPTLRVLKSHTGEVSSVAISADGSRVVSGSHDNTLHVWDLDGHTSPRTLDGNATKVMSHVSSVALTPDGKRVLFGSWDCAVRLMDLDSPKTPPRVFEGHTSIVNAVALSADGRRAVSGSADDTVRVWDLDGAALPRVLKGFTRDIKDVSLSADGSRAVSCSDETLQVWDLDNPPTPPCILKGHSDKVLAVAISANGKRVISGSWDNTVCVWDLDDLDSDITPRVLAGHTHWVTAVAISHDGRRAISGSGDNTVRLWDLDDHTLVRILEGHTSQVNAVALSSNGKRGVSGSRDKTVRVWDLDEPGPPQATESSTGWIDAVALGADGRRGIFVSDHSTTLRSWDLDDLTPPRIRKSLGVILAVALSADGKRAITGHGEGTVQVWDLNKWTSPQVLKGHAKRVMSVAISSDGRRAVSGSMDKTVRVWDLESLTPPRILGDDTASVYSVALSSNGRFAVSGYYDKTVRVWDLDGSEPPRVFEGHTLPVYVVALSANGRLALSGSSDKTVRIWDLAGAAPHRVLQGHTGPVHALEISEDGRLAVSCSEDATLRVWDLTNATCVAVFACDAEVVACSWRAKHILAGDKGGRVHLFRWLE
jgi:WD40 repeat protein